MRTWDEDGGPHFKKSAGRRPFAIEARVRHGAPRWVRLWRARGWFVWSRYRTERDRTTAMNALTVKHWYKDYEFRAAHGPEESK